MCGRYGLHHDPAEVIERFGIHRLPEELEPGDFERYNVAPTQTMPVVILQEGERTLERMRWGLIPSWAKDAKGAGRLINACGETVQEKASFRTAFRRRRCLVPASGFYEWIKLADGKQPLRIHRQDGGLLGMAGLWEEWKGPEGTLRSYSILTTAANELMQSIHHRMPVILSDEDEGRWLDPEADPAALQELLRPCLSERLLVQPVSRALNRVGFEGPDCLALAPT